MELCFFRRISEAGAWRPQLSQQKRTTIETTQFGVQCRVALRVIQVPGVQVSPQNTVRPREGRGVIRVDAVVIALCLTDIGSTFDASGGAAVTYRGKRRARDPVVCFPECLAQKRRWVHPATIVGCYPCPLTLEEYVQIMDITLAPQASRESEHHEFTMRATFCCCYRVQMISSVLDDFAYRSHPRPEISCLYMTEMTTCMSAPSAHW